MTKYEIKIVERKEDFLKIVDELRKEYGVERKGDTYMSEERLQKKYDEFANGEMQVAGVFSDSNTLSGFISYKITPNGLLVDNLLVFQDFRGSRAGTFLIKHVEKYAKEKACEQIYFGARRSANKFYFRLGFEGSCLIQSSKATKEDLENLMKKYNITEYSYNLYEGCNPPVNQIRTDAKYINNSNLLKEIDDSDLDIGCILTFSKQIQLSKQKTL